MRMQWKMISKKKIKWQKRHYPKVGGYPYIVGKERKPKAKNNQKIDKRRKR